MGGDGKRVELTRSMLSLWETDEMLKYLKEAYLEMDQIPGGVEVEEVLAFFCIFTVGCTQMGLDKLSGQFKRRADVYAVGLKEMGYQSGWYRLGLFGKCRKSWDRIIGAVNRRIKGGY